jgi:flagellar protein FlaI
MMAYLWMAVDSSKSIVFVGGTASGKTTAMNAVSLFIQPEMKIVSIEDTRNLTFHIPTGYLA